MTTFRKTGIGKKWVKVKHQVKDQEKDGEKAQAKVLAMEVLVSQMSGSMVFVETVRPVEIVSIIEF